MHTPVSFRNPGVEDLPAILALLADDMLGAARELPGATPAPAHLSAFAAIAADSNNELLVACQGGRTVGFLQITYIPGLSRQGAWRAQVEAVRIASDLRSQGIGRALMTEAIRRAGERGCRLVQLTTDKQRADAHRFYLQLGFVASHEGMKLALD
ncbi:MAG TPA: GNAT family N-acetyltransferase [Xanthomonadaceae bacterium]|nr:GNAT family N-acetyltransferase [Xanthomonadaceae bacterium]